MGVTEQGLAAIVKTRGNQDVHVILRGGSKGPNFASDHVKNAVSCISKARPGSHPSVMIDCSRTFLLPDVDMYCQITFTSFDKMETRKKITTISPRWSMTSVNNFVLETEISLVL